ncbi:MAG: bifunctional glutamate N-acetyltransferase/amino-acid acetyltransferase ArgJ [Pseudomonadota bacterium]
MSFTITKLVPSTPREGASPLAPATGAETLPTINGVRFSALEAGVRYKNRLDVMLAEVQPGASIAGVFTKSATRSAPVLWCEEALRAPKQPDAPFAILVNAGNANAFTGKNGFEATERLTSAVAARLNCPTTHVFPASTGVIGEPLPDDRITAKLDALVEGLAPDIAEQAAQAIMTTDTFVKGASLEIEIEGTPIRLMGIAKGSGMIAPDMATMLVYLFTDAAVAQPLLQDILSREVQTTFNAITVDGDTSTSDTLILAATGAAPMEPISFTDDPRATTFGAALNALMKDLAHQVVCDGEGATKFVEITVSGATSDTSAHTIALAIANSPLVKTALAGSDPNWGRIVMAIGKAGEPADRDSITIHFGDTLVAERGWVADSYSEEAGAAYFAQQEIDIRVDLGLGEGRATVWTCDLTHGYITINADYRS